jgi:hypothetical protein
VTGDGRLDLVIAGYRPPATGGPVSFGSSFVLLYAGSAKPANGSKTVSYQSATFHTVLKIGQLVAADFNRDGRADVLTTAQSTQTGFKVMLQLSGPGGSLPAPREVGFVIGGISVADFDNNGQLDFASSNRVYLGDGSGGFVLASNGPAGTSAKPVAAADVNADGKLDLVSANTVDAALTVLLGDGGGRLTAADTYLVGANISRLVAGDFDGDGYPDLVVLAGGQLLLLRNDGQW